MDEDAVAPLEDSAAPLADSAQATCFCFRDGDHYIGCVVYITACATYEEGMSEAKKIGTMLHEQGFVTHCVCRCIAPRSEPEFKN